MTIQLKKSLIGVAVAAACLVAPQAQAQSFAVQVNGIQCNDNAACDSDSTPNQITWLASVAGLSLTLISSLTNTPGGPAFSALDMAWLINNASASGAPIGVQFLASATGFTFPANGAASVLNNQLNGNFVGSLTVSGQSWVNASNALFGMSGVSAGPQGLNSNTSIAFISQTPYSITQELDFSVGAATLNNDNFASTVVPEPAPHALNAIALAGLAFARRREKNSL